MEPIMMINTISLAASRAIEIGRHRLDSIKTGGTRLSPRADVDRAMGEYDGTSDEMSTTEILAVRSALLEYAYKQLHGDRWCLGDGSH